jgi:hypothetical protein
MKEHTRSSPIGPALQEEGGSLDTDIHQHERTKQVQPGSGNTDAQRNKGDTVYCRRKPYLPRSVSSLVMRLRAMAYCCIDGCVGCRAADKESWVSAENKRARESQTGGGGKRAAEAEK